MASSSLVDKLPLHGLPSAVCPIHYDSIDCSASACVHLAISYLPNISAESQRRSAGTPDCAAAAGGSSSGCIRCSERVSSIAKWGRDRQRKWAVADHSTARQRDPRPCDSRLGVSATIFL